MSTRTYVVTVTVEGDNPNAGLPSLAGGQVSEAAADEYEIKRRLRGTFAHFPKMTATEIERAPEVPR